MVHCFLADVQVVVHYAVVPQELDNSLKAKAIVKDMLTDLCKILPGTQCGNDFIVYQNDQCLGHKSFVRYYADAPIYISKCLWCCVVCI